MFVVIDPSRDEPLFEQLAAAIRAEAVSGQLAEGERLPSAKELAQSLGVNLHTVLRAYQQLRDEGLVDLRRGRGAVITAAVTQWQGLRAEIEALIRAGRAAGITAEALSALVKENYR